MPPKPDDLTELLRRLSLTTIAQHYEDLGREAEEARVRLEEALGQELHARVSGDCASSHESQATV